MPAQPALTADQEKQVRARVRAGADIPSLQHFVKQKGWKVGRTKLGEIMRNEREHPTRASPWATRP